MAKNWRMAIAGVVGDVTTSLDQTTKKPVLNIVLVAPDTKGMTIKVLNLNPALDSLEFGEPVHLDLQEITRIGNDFNKYSVTCQHVKLLAIPSAGTVQVPETGKKAA